jgi:hypothetical protein
LIFRALAHLFEEFEERRIGSPVQIGDFRSEFLDYPLLPFWTPSDSGIGSGGCLSKEEGNTEIFNKDVTIQSRVPFET